MDQGFSREELNFLKQIEFKLTICCVFRNTLKSTVSWRNFRCVEQKLRKKHLFRFVNIWGSDWGW